MRSSIKAKRGQGNGPKYRSLGSGSSKDEYLVSTSLHHGKVRCRNRVSRDSAFEKPIQGGEIKTRASLAKDVQKFDRSFEVRQNGPHKQNNATTDMIPEERPTAGLEPWIQEGKDERHVVRRRYETLPQKRVLRSISQAYLQ